MTRDLNEASFLMHAVILLYTWVAPLKEFHVCSPNVSFQGEKETL